MFLPVYPSIFHISDPIRSDPISFKDSIREAHKNHTKSLVYLIGIIEDLYLDWHKYKGIDVSDQKSKIATLINEKTFDFQVLVREILIAS